MQFPSPWPIKQGHPQPNCIARPENPTFKLDFHFPVYGASAETGANQIQNFFFFVGRDERYFEFRFIVSRKFTCESQIQFHGIQLVWQESKFKLLWVHIKLESNRLSLGRRCKHIVGNYFFTACHCRQKTLVIL